MRWRPSTEPPRLAQLVVALLTPPQERQVLLSDLQDEYEERVLHEGTDRARRAFRRQAWRSVLPGLRWRLSRLLRKRGNPDPRVSPRWRPRPLIPTDVFNRGETMFDLWNDVKLGARGLTKDPLVFAATVISLALGIAATTTVFSMANSFLLRPPATPIGSNAVAIFTSEGDGELYGDSSYPDYLDVVQGAPAIDAAFLHRLGGAELEGGSGRKRLLVELVGGRYFELMGLDFTLGRGFTSEETPMGTAERLVVLSHELWHRRFGGDPDILGRTVRLDGRPYTVVGVGPKGYVSPLLGFRIDAWLPMGVPGGIYHVRASGLADRADRQYRVMARLRPGATRLQLQSQLDFLADRLHAEHSTAWSDHRDQPRRFTVLPEEEARLPGPMRAVVGSTFGLLLLATGVILLIACSNVACLFLARAHARRRELAIRLALGAGRRRLLVMLMAEALVPALVAGALGGLLAARVCTAFGSVMLPIGFPLQFDFQLDHRVLAFTLGVSLITSLLFGLFPALEGARPDLVTSLKADAGTGDCGGRKRPGHLGLRRLLVVGQVAASLAFVVGAALALRGLQQVTAADVGLDLEKNAIMSRDLPEDQFGAEEAQLYLTTIVERLRQRPEIADAHVSTSAELTFLTYVHKAPVEVEGFEPGKDESRVFSNNAVTPGYLEMMGVQLQRGRTFDQRDRLGAPLAAVVNEAFVERFWHGDSGLGRRFRVPGTDSESASKGPTDRSYEIVGVVADGRYNGLIDGGGPYFWTGLAQNPSHRVVLHVRGRATADEAVRALREEVELAPGEAANLLPMRYGDMAELELMLPRAISRLLGWGGVFGMVLAVFGIYGVVTFTVRLRRHEMAIRQAMGARPRQVVWALVKDGLNLSLWGLVAGLLIALPVAAILRSRLYGVSPLDPAVIGTCATVLLLAALVASFVPARQLSQADTMRILRGG